MASEVLVGLRVGAVAAASVAKALGSTRGAMDGLTTATRGLEIHQRRLGQTMSRELARGGTGLARQRAQYDRLGNSLRRVKAAQTSLAAATARSTAMVQANRQGWATLATTAMAAWGTIKTGMATAGQAAAFADSLRDIRISANLSDEQEAQLGAAIRAAVGPTNQDRDALAKGSKELLIGGSTAGEVITQVELMGNVLTGLRTSSEVTAGAMLALRDMGADNNLIMQRGLDRIIGIGQKGEFTPEMMLGAFSEMGDIIKQSGLKGEQQMANLAASLQVAEGSMGGDAKAGLQSWLSSMNDRRIAEAYKNVGVNYTASIAKMQAQGLDQFEASLELAGGFIRDKLSKKDQQALLKGDDDGRMATVLQELGLGEVFKDMNAARFALSINNNKGQYKELAGSSGDGSLNVLADLRKDSPEEQLKALKLNMSELGLDIGTVLLPPLLEVTESLKPIVAGIREFAQANPGVIRTIAGVVTGLVAMKVAFVAVGFGISSLILTPFAQARTGFKRVNAVWEIFRARLTMGIPLFSKIGGSIGGFAKTVLGLGKALGGKLLSGAMMAGKAIMFVGRALLMNPIGLLITGIAVAAYLIYKYWEPIKAFFSGLWEGIKGVFSSTWEWITSTVSGAWDTIKGVFSSAWSTLTSTVSNLWNDIKNAFGGGLSGVGELIVNWSPLSLFYQAFSGVMSWFGIELPGKFSEFGGQLISGLIDGIVNMDTAIKDAIFGLGENVTGWFKEKLGINSPSKVFMELGAGVPEGAALGISDNAGMVRDAALGLAKATDVKLATPTITSAAMKLPSPGAVPIPAPPAALTTPAAGGFGGGGMTVNFSPVIQIKGDANLQEQIKQAVKLSFTEFEKMMRQYQERTGRRAYGDIK